MTMIMNRPMASRMKTIERGKHHALTILDRKGMRRMCKSNNRLDIVSVNGKFRKTAIDGNSASKSVNSSGGDNETFSTISASQLTASVRVPENKSVSSNPFLAIAASSSALIAIAVAAVAMRGVLNKPSRTYHSEDSVGNAYDDWTNEGVLEYYWGDHIHLGYYK